MGEKQTEVSESGIWINNDTGKIVHKQPVSGVQLVPPGGEMRPDRKAAVKAAEVAAKGGDADPGDLSPGHDEADRSAVDVVRPAAPVKPTAKKAAAKG